MSQSLHAKTLNYIVLTLGVKIIYNVASLLPATVESHRSISGGELCIQISETTIKKLFALFYETKGARTVLFEANEKYGEYSKHNNFC